MTDAPSAGERARQADLDPAVGSDADREGLDRLRGGWDHRLAAANVETAAVPRADEDAVARVEAGLGQREVRWLQLF